MAISKQAFYEGAALHRLVKAGLIQGIRYESPFFLLSDDCAVLLKYSTRGRSPWPFTFTPDEQIAISAKANTSRTMIGLICGKDGVAAINYDAYSSLASRRDVAIRISCYRDHGEHYDVSGPDGRLDAKVAPSNWLNLFRSRAYDEAPR